MRGAENVAREQWRGKKRDKRPKQRSGKGKRSGQYQRTVWGELRRSDGRSNE